MAVYQDIRGSSCFFNELKRPVKVALNVKILVILNLQVQIPLNLGLGAIHLPPLGGGDHGLDVELWVIGKGTFEGGEVLGGFGVGDVQGAGGGQALEDAAEVGVHREDRKMTIIIIIELIYINLLNFTHLML